MMRNNEPNGGPALADPEYRVPRIWSHPTTNVVRCYGSAPHFNRPQVAIRREHGLQKSWTRKPLSFILQAIIGRPALAVRQADHGYMVPEPDTIRSGWKA